MDKPATARACRTPAGVEVSNYYQSLPSRGNARAVQKSNSAKHASELSACFSPALLYNSRDPKEPKVCDHHFIGVMKNVFGLQVFVHNAFGVKITHSLCWKKQWLLRVLHLYT